jgi:GT2 family glycosyltransferase
MEDRLIEIDVLQPPTDVALDDAEGAYVVVWAGPRPLDAHWVRPVGGRIDPAWLKVMVWKYRGAGSEREPPAQGFQPLATVVVMTFRHEAQLPAILAALEAQAYGDFEIVVVDNAPQQSSAPAVVERFARARCVAEPREGIRYARNTGVQAARGEVVAFIDDDCTPQRDWLANLVSGLREPEVACCTGLVLPRRLQTRAQWLLEMRGGFNRGFERKVYSVENPEAQRLHLPLHAWQCGSGANMVFRKSTLAAVGGFNEMLPAAEEIDAFFRLLRRGRKIVYEPMAAIRHDYPETYAGLQRRMYDWGRGHISYLLHVAANDPEYRQAAREDIANWFSYQGRQRLWPQLRGKDPFPLGLTLREVYGGAEAFAGFWLRRLRARLGGR